MILSLWFWEFAFGVCFLLFLDQVTLLMNYISAESQCHFSPYHIHYVHRRIFYPENACVLYRRSTLCIPLSAHSKSISLHYNWGDVVIYFFSIPKSVMMCLMTNAFTVQLRLNCLDYTLLLVVT